MVPIISTASSHSTREILWALCAVINKVTTQQAKGTHHNVHATSLFSVFVQDTADLPGNGRSNLLDTWYWSEFVTQLHSAPQLSQSTKFCISQSACVANHIDTAGSNDQVKMLLILVLTEFLYDFKSAYSIFCVFTTFWIVFVCLFIQKDSYKISILGQRKWSQIILWRREKNNLICLSSSNKITTKPQFIVTEHNICSIAKYISKQVSYRVFWLVLLLGNRRPPRKKDGL